MNGKIKYNGPALLSQDRLIANIYTPDLGEDPVMGVVSMDEYVENARIRDLIMKSENDRIGREK